MKRTGLGVKTVPFVFERRKKRCRAESFRGSSVADNLFESGSHLRGDGGELLTSFRVVIVIEVVEGTVVFDHVRNQRPAREAGAESSRQVNVGPAVCAA